MEFSRPEYWSGVFLSPEDLLTPVMEPRSPTSQADSLPAEPQGRPGSLNLLGAANSNTLKEKTGHDEFSPVRRILQEKLAPELGFCQFR